MANDGTNRFVLERKSTCWNYVPGVVNRETTKEGNNLERPVIQQLAHPFFYQPSFYTFLLSRIDIVFPLSGKAYPTYYARRVLNVFCV